MIIISFWSRLIYCMTPNYENMSSNMLWHHDNRWLGAKGHRAICYHGDTRCTRNSLSTPLGLPRMKYEMDWLMVKQTGWRQGMEKRFSRYWPFVRGIHRSPVGSPHKGLVMLSCFISVDVSPSILFNKQPSCRWIAMRSRSYNVTALNLELQVCWWIAFLMISAMAP